MIMVLRLFTALLVQRLFAAFECAAVRFEAWLSSELISQSEICRSKFLPPQVGHRAFEDRLR